MTQKNSSPFFSFSNVTCQTAWKAWNLFVVSAFIAVLFNTFYPYGIELRPAPTKKLSLQEIKKNSPPSSPAYAGWKKNTDPILKKTPVRASTASDKVPRLSLVGTEDRFDRKAAVFLDARKTEENREGHIPGALLFPALEMDKYAPLVMPQLTDKKKEIIAYCDGGDCTLSLELARMLMDQGYTHVEVFEGGFPVWKKASHPVNKGDKP